jgi:hypothetical protein
MFFVDFMTHRRHLFAPMGDGEELQVVLPDPASI